MKLDATTEAALARALSGLPSRALPADCLERLAMKLQTRSGVPSQPAYLAPHGEGERPGEFPFTRGRLSNPHAQTTWIQREL
jgi:hypothetical protein